METLIIEETIETPHVELDIQTGSFTFSGKSLPEDVKEFYKPIMEWIEAYTHNPKPNTSMNIKLEYFNTSSSKMILIILKQLIEATNNGSKVIVNWYYPSDDEEIYEAGEEYSDIIKLKFNFIQY